MNLITTISLITTTLIVTVTCADVCQPTPCGTNAICTTRNNVAACACPKGFGGDPFVICTPQECLNDEQCRPEHTCVRGTCTDPCIKACGVNALCQIKHIPERVPLCTCPVGYDGDPFKGCFLTNNTSLCVPSPCGINTKCEIINDVATCSCQKGYMGSALTGCYHECETDAECPINKACSQFRCIRSCNKCAPTASCKKTGEHTVECTCPQGFSGHPERECIPECQENRDCGGDRPACYYGICKHPCNGTCGEEAVCRLGDGLVPVCSCPKGMTGDPFAKCRPITARDLCTPNVCGINAKCSPGQDAVRGLIPICSCPPGYYGNSIKECIKGECATNPDCPHTRVCLGARCHNPCINQCGDGAGCDPRNHSAVCFCPPNTTGNALLACNPISP